MFYVFFDSVLVCGALFDTAFHEVREASRTSSKSHRSPEESKKESSMDLVFADSMVWTVDLLKEVQGFPDAFRFDNVSDSIAASLIGLSVSPIVAQIVASSCDWNGSVRVKKKVEALERYLEALHGKKLKKLMI